MRRDLNRGCAACRLRFSELLTFCPVCRAAALSVQDATNQIQPTSRAAWLAKWVIVLSCIPAVGAVAWTGTLLLKEGWPPQSALDVLIYVLGSFGTCLGASIFIAIPLALWFGVITAIRFILKFVVDRPRRKLRVTIELAPRSSATKNLHPMHRLWDKIGSFITKHIEEPTRLVIIVAVLFLGAQILAEIFGDEHFIKTSSFKDFGTSIFMLAFVDFMGVLVLALFIGIFSAFVEKAQKFFAQPPNLFGYDPTPPPVQNETCLESFVRNRHEIEGRAVALDDEERAALELLANEERQAYLSESNLFGISYRGRCQWSARR
jgi:hypothetical protein